MSESQMETEKTYIGLWTKNDKNGNPYLNGSKDDLVYFIFRDGKDPTKKTLHTLDKTIDGAKLKEIGVLETKIGKGDVEYQQFENMCIFKNERREKETHPHFNLVIYEDKKA